MGEGCAKAIYQGKSGLCLDTSWLPTLCIFHCKKSDKTHRTSCRRQSFLQSKEG